jgi:hypothetical protein
MARASTTRSVSSSLAGMRTLLAPVLWLAAATLSCDGTAEPSAPAPSEPSPSEDAWSACLRPSQLEGVARETAPGLELEIEGVRVVTGSLGQRGPDVDAAGDVLRIAAVGGDLAFGTGLAAEEAWPLALGRQLNHSMLSAGKRVEVLDLGTVRASASDVLGLARQRALPWQPWLMVLELDSSRLGDGGQDGVRSLLAQLRSESAQAQCGVLVAVSLPLGEPLGDAYAHATTHAFLIDEAQRAGFSTLDLREVLAGATQTERGHATVHAQGLVLEAVKRRLFDSGLLTAALESH